MRKNNSSLLFALVLLGFFIYKTFFSSIERSAGILVPEKPSQVNFDQPRLVDKVGKYSIIAKADYQIKARVLGVENYWFDHGSILSPLDFALGWQEMSDTQNLKYLSINQYGRFYFYSWKGEAPIEPEEIILSSANVHLIPKNESILARLKKIKTGNIVNLKGYLVDVQGPNQFKWQSSMVRTDKGNGACELLYVTDLNYY